MKRKLPAMKRKLPEHIPGTLRGWKVRKRAELKALRAAHRKYMMGCAYCPGRNGEVGDLGLDKSAATLTEALNK